MNRVNSAWCGVTVAGMVACGALADWGINCCKEVWSFPDPEEDGEPCSGQSGMSCEGAPLSENSGKYWSSSHRPARCFYGYGDEVVLRAPCWADPGPAWKRLPGVMTDGNCCFVKTTSLQEFSQNFQIYPCAAPGCNNPNP